MNEKANFFLKGKFKKTFCLLDVETRNGSNLKFSGRAKFVLHSGISWINTERNFQKMDKFMIK